MVLFQLDCGDHILEQHIHNIDIANWFIGEYPSEAQGMGGRQVRNGKDHGQIFDHHFVEFHYRVVQLSQVSVDIRKELKVG